MSREVSAGGRRGRRGTACEARWPHSAADAAVHAAGKEEGRERGRYKEVTVKRLSCQRLVQKQRTARVAGM